MKSSVLRTRSRASALLSALVATLTAAACTSPSSAGMQPAKLSMARAGTLNARADLVTTFGHAATATAIDSAQCVAAGPVRPSTIAQPEHWTFGAVAQCEVGANSPAFAAEITDPRFQGLEGIPGSAVGRQPRSIVVEQDPEHRFAVTPAGSTAASNSGWTGPSGIAFAPTSVKGHHEKSHRLCRSRIAVGRQRRQRPRCTDF